MRDETDSNSTITPSDSPASVPVTPATPVTPTAPVSDNINDMDYGRSIKDYGHRPMHPKIKPQGEM